MSTHARLFGRDSRQKKAAKIVMKYKLLAAYHLGIKRNEQQVRLCEMRLAGIFSSHALPRVGEKIIIPVSVKLPWSIAIVQDVFHSGANGVLKHQVECQILEDLDYYPDQKEVCRLKEVIANETTQSAKRFGLKVESKRFFSCQPAWN